MGASLKHELLPLEVCDPLVVLQVLFAHKEALIADTSSAHLRPMNSRKLLQGGSVIGVVNFGDHGRETVVLFFVAGQATDICQRCGAMVAECPCRLAVLPNRQ